MQVREGARADHRRWRNVPVDFIIDKAVGSSSEFLIDLHAVDPATGIPTNMVLTHKTVAKTGTIHMPASIRRWKAAPCSFIEKPLVHRYGA